MEGKRAEGKRALFASLGLATLAASTSFGVAAAAAPVTPGSLLPIVSVANPSFALRHCSYVLSANPVENDNPDFRFVLVAARNGAPPPAFSIAGAAFPDNFFAPLPSGAIGLVEGGDVDDATFLLESPSLVCNGTCYTLRSASKGAFAGQVVTWADTRTMPCGYAAPCGDAVLAPAAASGPAAAKQAWVITRPPPVSIRVNTSVVTNPAVNPNWMGCHSDYGFAQTPRGFTSNLLYGSSFEDGTNSVPAWMPYSAGGATGSTGPATSTSFSGKASTSITIDASSPPDGEFGLSNRGNGRAGLYLEGGKPYNSTVWLWTGAPSDVFMELRDFTTNTTLARVDFTAKSVGPDWGTNWFPYTFELTPSVGTTCVGIEFGSDPGIDCGNAAGPAHVCVRCGGEFIIGLKQTQKGGDSTNVKAGFVSLSPQAWGLVVGPDGPLPILKSAADVLTSMGITFMRAGGSVSQSMRWQDHRGPVWKRPSQRSFWGFSLLSGFGPFEYVDFCNALDITPSLTFAYDVNDALDWADLVEYAWGDASTSWGARRIADGHTRVYNVTYFELGNEQVNPLWVDQVAAMEKRAAAVGAPPLHYIYPTNDGLQGVDAQRALDLGLPIDRIAPDLHVGAGGAVEAAAGLFANPPVPGFTQGAINQETNAGTHDLTRALDEAADLLDFFTAPLATTSRIWARTSSFCSGSSAQFDTWDQGISFFLPNMTWLQPPGYVHVMLKNTWAPVTLLAEVTAGDAIPFAAQRSGDGKTLFLRAVNKEASAVNITISFPGAPATGDATLWTLGGADAGADNTPSAPTAISPVQRALPLARGATALVLSLASYTFGIVSVPVSM